MSKETLKHVANSVIILSVVLMVAGFYETVQVAQRQMADMTGEVAKEGAVAENEGLFQKNMKLSEDELVIINDKQKKHQFNIELALTFDQQQRGLMNREKIKDDYGMLFYYSRIQETSMWMKNTLIPLDMLFIDDEGKILHIAENAKPYDERAIFSRFPVRATLEIKGGQVAERGIKVGDTVYNSYFGNTEK